MITSPESEESSSAAAKFEGYAERKDGLECYRPETIRERRRKLSVAGVRAVHVGDSLQHDVNGAVNAGIDVEDSSPSMVYTEKDLYTLKDGDKVGGTNTEVHELDPQDLLNGTCDLCDRLGVLRPSYIVETFSM